MSVVKYQKIVKKDQSDSGAILMLGDDVVGEYWTTLTEGALTCMFQLNDSVVTTTITERDNYLPAEEQLDNIIEAYLAIEDADVCRVLAKGRLTYRRDEFGATAIIGGKDIFSISTLRYHHKTAMIDNLTGHQYYVDFHIPELFDPLLIKGQYINLIGSSVSLLNYMKRTSPV